MSEVEEIKKLENVGVMTVDVNVKKKTMALSKNLVIYHRGERRVRRVFRPFQSLLVFSGAFAVSMCSAVKFKGIAISLENSTVPRRLIRWRYMANRR